MYNSNKDSINPSKVNCALPQTCLALLCNTPLVGPQDMLSFGIYPCTPHTTSVGLPPASHIHPCMLVYNRKLMSAVVN